MNITTSHSTRFEFATSNTDQHTAARVIIENGSANYGVACQITPNPLAEGAEPSVRSSTAALSCADLEALQVCLAHVTNALDLIGVKAK